MNSLHIQPTSLHEACLQVGVCFVEVEGRREEAQVGWRQNFKHGPTGVEALKRQEGEGAGNTAKKCSSS